MSQEQGQAIVQTLKVSRDDYLLHGPGTPTATRLLCAIADALMWLIERAEGSK